MCSSIIWYQVSKHCKITNRINASCFIGTWCWKKEPRNGEESRHLTALNSLVAYVQLLKVYDSWIWKVDNNGDSNVRSLCALMYSQITSDDRLQFHQIAQVPIKGKLLHVAYVTKQNFSYHEPHAERGKFVIFFLSFMFEYN